MLEMLVYQRAYQSPGISMVFPWYFHGISMVLQSPTLAFRATSWAMWSSGTEARGKPLRIMWLFYVRKHVRKHFFPQIYIYIVSPKKIEKLQPEKRREFFSGLQTFLSLVSTVNLQGFLNFDDFKCTIPCKFTGDTKDRKVLRHKNDRIMFSSHIYADDTKDRKAWKSWKPCK